MQINKKLFSSAIIALLVLSVVAAAAPAFAANSGAIGLFVPATTPVTPISNGPVGTKVAVVGAATAAAPYNTVNVYWDTISASNLLGTVGAASDGSFRVDITVPSAIIGAHSIVVSDGVVPNVGIPFTVDASLVSSTTPATKDTVLVVDAKVLPGDSLTLTGHGFGATKAVTATFTGAVTVVLTGITITTNSTGSFSAVITVPAIAVANYGAYTVSAGTTSPTATATSPVLVDYYATVTPASGPTGITVTIAGRIPASTAYSVNFGSAIGVRPGTSSATGAFSETYPLAGPIIVGGSYSATVIWAVTNSRSATFTGAPSPTITAGYTASGAPGTNITLSGTGFTASAALTVKLGTNVVTATTITTSTTGGAFTAKQFTVPAIAPGTYVLEVVDQYGATTGTGNSFTVLVAPTTTISLRASSYAQGETLSFSIITTEATTGLGTVNVYVIDPAARTQFSSNVWGASLTAAATDGTRYIQYQAQVDLAGNHFTLSSDAQTGTWNWTITYLPASLGGATLVTATGLFTVTAKVTLDSTNTKLDAITTTLGQVNTTVNANKAVLTTIDGNVVTIKTDVATIKTDVASLKASVTSIDGKVVTLQTSMGTVTASVNSLSASISSISSGVATITTKVGTIQTSLDSIDAVLGYVAGDTATITTSLGTVTTSLASINPTLTSIENGIATIKTDVGTLQGTVTSISNNVATIQTGVGTLQANVANLQPDVTAAKDNSAGVSTLVYVAIVLALVAAIAAIASIFLMRQKIAG